MYLLVHEQPVYVLPSLATRIGLNEAIMLQQIHLHSSEGVRSKDGSVWIKRTLDDWSAEFPWWSASTIRRTLDSLTGRALVKRRQEASGKDRGGWYAIDYAVLETIAEHGNPGTHPDTSVPEPEVEQPAQAFFVEDDEPVATGIHQEIMSAYATARGSIGAVPSRTGKAARACIKDGILPEHIGPLYRYYKHEPSGFWRDKPLELEKLRQYWDAWMQAGKPDRKPNGTTIKQPAQPVAYPQPAAYDPSNDGLSLSPADLEEQYHNAYRERMEGIS